MREQQHKPTLTPTPIPIPILIPVPAEEELHKREERIGFHRWENPKAQDSPSRAQIPVSCPALALGFAVPGNLPSVGKPTRITWRIQPGSKVASAT